MIRSLHIKNLALISDINLEFDSGLNVLSGETGAGKSIIVDSLILLLGGRYDKTILRYGEKSGFVEAVFDAETIKEELASLGFDEEDELIVCRKFSTDGKNEIRVNGRIATLSMLKKITPPLLDMCGQNEHQSLGNISNHIKVLDYYVRHNSADFKKKLQDLRQELSEVNEIINSIGDEDERRRNADFLTFQISEIEAAAVKDGEEDELLELRKKMYGVESVKEGLSSVCNILSEGEDGSVSTLLGEALSKLNKLSKFSRTYEDLAQRIEAAISEIDDISQISLDELDSLDFSDEDLDELEKRLATVRAISKKYGKGEDLAKTYEALKSKLFDIENADEIYNKAVIRKDKLLKEAYEICKKLSHVRKEGAKTLEGFVEKELATLGMQSVFRVNFNEFPLFSEFEKQFSANGVDEVEFYLSANVGQPLNPLVKIISGGELSRLMLAFKIVSSNIDGTPSMVFDEIDTGISGKIGLEVAKKLAFLAKDHQILCVTHLPQICSMADKNFYISKSNDGEKTYTQVKELDCAETYGEIARLMGAKDISEQTVVAAKDMKNWSNDFKSAL